MKVLKVSRARDGVLSCMPSASHQDDLLARIFALRSGVSTFGHSERIAFFKDLVSFHGVLAAQNVDFVTIPAIRGWLHDSQEGRRSLPTRNRSLEFLYEYLKSIEHELQLKDSSRRLEFETLLQALLPAAVRNKARLDQDVHARRIAPAHLKGGHGQQAVPPIQGTYQLIRPYANADDRYVLEAMEITTAEDGVSPILLMYSHTAPENRYVYRGAIAVRNRYCFAMLDRLHEDVRTELSSRCVCFYYGGYVPAGLCLSGVVLRGAKAETIGRMVMGMPFIAIRLGAHEPTLRQAKFARVGGSNVHRMNRASRVIVGDIGEDDGELYRFCNAVYDALNQDMREGLTIHSVSSRKIQDAINSYAPGEKHAFEVWNAEVETFLTAVY
jgi:hypothetical protein